MNERTVKYQVSSQRKVDILLLTAVSFDFLVSNALFSDKQIFYQTILSCNCLKWKRHNFLKFKNRQKLNTINCDGTLKLTDNINFVMTD